MDWPNTCTVLLLLPLLQHFPESSFTALFLISWIGPTSTIFQHYYYFFYYQIRLLLLLLQHFPERLFTALFFISWIGPTSTIFQQNYYSFLYWTFVQRLKLLNLAHFYGLAKWNGVMCPCYVNKGQATFNYPAAPHALELCGLWLHGRQSNSLGMQPTWQRPVPTSAFIV